MTPGGKKIDKRREAFMTRLITPILRDAGFSGGPSKFSRAEGSLQHVVEVQRSQWNTSTDRQFTLNCGVFVPGVVSVFRDAADPRVPSLGDCCMFVRVGMLAKAHLDIWWPMPGDTVDGSDEAVREEVRVALSQLVFPFLGRFRDETAVEAFLAADPTPDLLYVEPRAPALRLSYAGLLQLKRGSEACQSTLARAAEEARNGPLAAHVGALVKRVGSRA